jgi:hypothetical protein
VGKVAGEQLHQLLDLQQHQEDLVVVGGVIVEPSLVELEIE